MTLLGVISFHITWVRTEDLGGEETFPAYLESGTAGIPLQKERFLPHQPGLPLSPFVI